MSSLPVDQETVERHHVRKHSKPWRLPKFHLPHLPSIVPSYKHPAQKRTGPLDFTKNIPTNIPYPPFVNVEGVPNFRDLGGYNCLPPPGVPQDTELDFIVRSGFVYRCSELSQISPNGLIKMVSDLNIKVLYDFRSEREAADLKGQPQGVLCISTPVFRLEDITPGMGAQQLTWGTAPDTPPDAGFSQGYVDWYRQIAVVGGKHAYRNVFEHIRDQPDEPVVYHCTAGKDRTGVITAIILKLCGVDDETVAWEYSLTVPGMGVWEEIVEQEMVGDSMMPIRSHGGMTREEARRICGSRASNMAEWLKQVLHGEFGGARQYLKNYCHFNDADIDKIVHNLVVPGNTLVRAVSFPLLEQHPQT